jgi:hypothetical protein
LIPTATQLCRRRLLANLYARHLDDDLCVLPFSNAELIGGATMMAALKSSKS